MPILKELGEEKTGMAVVMGCGDVHTTQAICVDKNTGLPNMAKSFVGFVEMDTPEVMEAGGAYQIDPATMPAPNITLHFTELAVLDHFMKALEIFRKTYVAKVAAITRNAAQA